MCGDPKNRYLRNILYRYQLAEKTWLAVFIVTCALILAAVLELFQLKVHSAISCVCTLPSEPSPEGLQLGGFTFAQKG